MVDFTKEADEVWRDYATDGVPGSGAHQPVPGDIRTWGGELESVAKRLKAAFPAGSVITIGGLVSQSNLYANDDATTGSNKGTNANVFAWANSSSSFVTAALGSDPFRPDSGPGIPNNCVFQFAKWVQEQTGATVYVFLHAISNTASSVWKTVANGGPNNSTNRYDKTTDTASGTVLKTQTLVEAMFAHSTMTSAGKSRFDFVVMFRGENDDDFGVDACEADFLTLIDQIRAETWADDETVVLACEMLREENKYPNAIEAWHRIVRHNQRTNVAVASTYGIPSVGDGTHVTGAGLETIGRERLPAALYSLVAPRQIPGAYEGRPNIIDVNEATTAGSPKVITIDAPNTIIDVLYSSADTWLEIDPLTVGRGGTFTVRHWATNYVTHVTCDNGATFDPDTWQASQTQLDIGVGESVEFFKGGSLATGPYQIRSAFRRDLRDRDPRNAILNGDMEFGTRNWSMGAGWTMNFDAANAYSGRWVAVNTDTSGAAVDLEAKNYVRANPGDTVVAEVYGKASGATMSVCRIRIPYYDDGLAELSDEIGANFNTIGSTYEKMMVMGVAPADTFHVRPRIRLGKTAGTFYADDMRLHVIGKHQPFAPQWMIQTADRTLTSTTSLQKIFDEETTGDADVEKGFYHFRMRVRLSSLSSTSDDIGFGFLGTATATVELDAIANKGSGTGTAQMTDITATAGTSLVSDNVSTAAKVWVEGIVNVTAAGTLIPGVTLGTAAAATVEALSWATLTRIPANGTGKVAMGLWA